MAADMTKNFSGAEIEGLVNSARSFAFNREVDVRNLNKQINEDNLKVLRFPSLTPSQPQGPTPCIPASESHGAGQGTPVGSPACPAIQGSQAPARMSDVPMA